MLGWAMGLWDGIAKQQDAAPPPQLTTALGWVKGSKLGT